MCVCFFFLWVQAQRARLFCKCVGVQGLLEKYAASSSFIDLFIYLFIPFIYLFPLQNASSALQTWPMCAVFHNPLIFFFFFKNIFFPPQQ